MSQQFSSIATAQLLVKAFELNHINQVVISPGSRNAPLTIAFSNHPSINTYSIVDERSAAFFALGMTQHLQRPVAVICTSGSALANYYPAVTEAYYSQLPLIVLSADRPSHLLDIGDGQTIKQRHFFGEHVGYAANLKDDTHQQISVEDFNFNKTEVQAAISTAYQQQLPVHINAAFDEPLYHTTEKPFPEVESLSAIEIPEHNKISEELVSKFINDWNSAERKLVLVGVNSNFDFTKELVEVLANDPSVIVMTEVTSNIAHKHFFQNIDALIAPVEQLDDAEVYFKGLQPDLLLSLGGMLVSKKLKSFLRTYQPKAHYQVHPQRCLDTFFTNPIHLKSTVKEFSKQVVAKLQPVESNYFEHWYQQKTRIETIRERYIQEIDYSDFKVFASVFSALPKNEHMHFANSSTVRYANLFDSKTPLIAFSNRGTSGIDGSTSTAIGYAVASQHPTTIITGDLSFFYDSNALWNNYLTSDFKIIVINNSGGGIFRILPGDKQADYFHTYFETRHQLTAKHLSKMFGLSYFSAENLNDLEVELSSFFENSQKPKILEIFTPTEVNDQVLLSYFKYINKHLFR